MFSIIANTMKRKRLEAFTRQSTLELLHEALLHVLDWSTFLFLFFLLRISFRWLSKFQLPEKQQARWIEGLENFDFSEHKSGIKHNANALSRDTEELKCRNRNKKIFQKLKANRYYKRQSKLLQENKSNEFSLYYVRTYHDL